MFHRSNDDIACARASKKRPGESRRVQVKLLARFQRPSDVHPGRNFLKELPVVLDQKDG
jgi:hypothetical protein